MGWLRLLFIVSAIYLLFCLFFDSIWSFYAGGLKNVSKNTQIYPNDASMTPARNTFFFLVHAYSDIVLLTKTICLLKEKRYFVRILLMHTTRRPSFLFSQACSIWFDATMDVFPTQEWWSGNGTFSSPDVIISVEESPVYLPSFVTPGYTPISIPRADLGATTWMASLSTKEWQNWHAPRLELSIITKDRPASLARLLSSISTAKFFGDRVDLRVYMEQSTDQETLKMVDAFVWPHGSVFTHHRIIPAGLMPAIVESWYPHSNHSYGALLEDDVEVSPLFYAWVKMCLLHYRYDDIRNISPKLFGISLYQQKHLELPLPGRRPFDAKELFAANNLPYPDTPYLSQVPCSWGAVYFPEHWREFHSYLSIRLAQLALPLSHHVVPDVRSNNWKRSWKKYFIELAYLRGYVMLYPNFQNFASLSTNHLEPGSHVTANDRTKEKKDLFQVPLVQNIREIALPNRHLSDWQHLPVLNLTGSLHTLRSLVRVGYRRRDFLVDCPHSPALFDAVSLMCVERDDEAS